ncbi:MAG: hypothetical protein ACJ79K_09805 [Gemmatimonadaceae bacterium]
MRSLRTLALLGVLTAAPAACVHGAKNAPEEPPTFLRVENQSLSDATVYVWQSSTRLRMGRVSSLSSATMRIPPSTIFGPTPLRFQLDFLAGPRSPLTESITVVPGDTVVMQVPPQ